MMLIGVAVGLAIFGIIAIAAIFCFACGKYKRLKTTPKADQNSRQRIRASRLQRMSRILPWIYPRMAQEEEHSGRQVLALILSQIYHH